MAVKPCEQCKAYGLVGGKKCLGCGGTGVLKGHGKGFCLLCGGTGRVGTTLCTECSGSGSAEQVDTELREKAKAEAEAKTGGMLCPFCKGNKKVKIDQMTTCPLCDGSGRWNSGPCAHCDKTGSVEAGERTNPYFKDMQLLKIRNETMRNYIHAAIALLSGENVNTAKDVLTVAADIGTEWEE